MPKLRFGLICIRVVTDRDTNLASYIDVLEGFKPPALPYDIPPFSVCISLIRNDDDADAFTVRFRMTDPEGQNMDGGDGASVDVSFQGKQNLRVNFELSPFPLTTAGTHNVVVEYGGEGARWRKLGTIPFDVRE